MDGRTRDGRISYLRQLLIIDKIVPDQTPGSDACAHGDGPDGCALRQYSSMQFSVS